MFLLQHTCLMATASTNFSPFCQNFQWKNNVPSNIPRVFSSSWLRGYDSSAAFTFTCLQHSLFLLCRHVWWKPSSKVPYYRSPTFSGHVLTNFLTKILPSIFLFLAGPDSVGRIMKTSSPSLRILFLWSYLIQEIDHLSGTSTLEAHMLYQLLVLKYCWLSMQLFLPGSGILKISSWISRNL